MMEQEFYARRQAKMSLVAGAGLFVVSLIAVGSSPIFPVAPFTIAGAMIGAGLWFQYSPVVRLMDDHLVVKLAPIRPTKTLLYSEIKRVEVTKRHYIVHYRRHDAGSDAVKTLKIPATSLAKEERDACGRALSSRVPAAAA
ncbi:hypothetical protein [Salinicola avicenniae]|uniref:hypothetical protein n=1 Tax=Salinicola avicenniae TaxID=2916836 RepID=UPI002072FDAF|nr:MULTISPECIES: hypothetical protein [unclassified Salinicola]